jgi:hypothetical protein
MDPVRFPKLIGQLYAVTDELTQMFKRPFTPDGHMVGSIGEALAAFHYGLKLTPPSTKGCDATLGTKRIEIKATQANRVAFRSEPEYLIVLKIERDGTFEEIYNGKGNRVWSSVSHKPLPSNGQHQVSIFALRKLNKLVHDNERIQQVQPVCV